MEDLSLKDRRHRQSTAFAPKIASYDRYVSRLPTPDESTPGHRSSDDERRNKVTRRHSPDHSNLRPSRYDELLPHDTPFPRMASERRIPDSPPYQPSDALRPSLPPLKTILANSLTSPPRSPIFSCALIQPSPQEPAYTSTTYKPPSLYPQKKQRTDYVLEPVPPFHAAGSSSSPRFDNDAFSRAPVRAPPKDTILSPREKVSDSRRMSLQPQLGRSFATSPRASQQAPQPSYTTRSPKHNFPIGNEAHEASRSAMYAPGSQGLRQGAVYENSIRNDYDGRVARRDSTQATYDSGCARADHVYDVLSSDGRQARPCGPGNDYTDDMRYVRRADMTPSERPLQAHYDPCQPQQPSFFMPNQYDYRHSRARKRSNLPKQSTEIMKTWFDQNITNPYPSEEQKAVFSHATGISMTQVSNWFINHRRRCPELRDKRERTRGRDFDH